MKPAGLVLTIAVTALLAGTVARADAETPQAGGDSYQSGDYGRVRYQENGPSILRAQADQTGHAEDAATANSPIFPGDTVRDGSDQRTEIELADGTIVRLDQDTELDFDSLPQPGAQYQDNTVLKLKSGVIRISSSRGGGEFRVDTPASSVYLPDDADVRIEVDGSGETRVLSRRGVVEVAGEGGSVLVRSGLRSVAEPGAVPSDPVPFNTFSGDPFDRWVIARDDAYRAPDRYTGGRRVAEDDGDQGSYEAVPDEVRPYYRELSSYGRWVWAPPYGWVWYPSDVAPGWRPYNDGYWDYGPDGYFWVSYEPWGWAPYHFGRWNWIAGFGWGWIPGRVFGGAWVSWSFGPSFVGWCPLDFWGRPAFISVASVSFGFFDPGCWTFVEHAHFGARNVRPFAISAGRLGVALQTAAVVTRPPRISPSQLASSSVWRERAFREARDDRSFRVAPISRTGAPGTRFTDLEARAPRRGPSSPASGVRGGTGLAGRAPGGGIGSRPITPRLGPGGPGTSGGRSLPGAERGGSGARMTAPNREGGAAGSRSSGRREATTPGREGEYPRRYTRDPRAAAPAPSRGATPGQQEGRRDTRDRVRDMYQRFSQPRETRQRQEGRQYARPTVPSESRPPWGEPRRVEPRSSPPSYRPQAAPRYQPPRQQAPRFESSRQQAPRFESPRQQAPRFEPRSQPRSQQSAPSGGRGRNTRERK